MITETIENAVEAMKFYHFEIDQVFDYQDECGEYAIFFKGNKLKGEYKRTEYKSGFKTELWISAQYMEESEATYFTERMVRRFIENHEYATIAEVLFFAVTTLNEASAIEAKAMNN